MQDERSLRKMWPVAIWLAVFVSPTAYLFLLAYWSRWRLPTPPVDVVVYLFGVISIVALLVCQFLVWRKKSAVGWRVGQLVLTVLGMVLQVGALLLIVRAILVATISYGQ